MKDYIAISREIKRRGEAKVNARRRRMHHAMAACLLLCICIPVGFGVWQLTSPAELPVEVPSEIPSEETTAPLDTEGLFPPGTTPGFDVSEEPGEEPAYSAEQEESSEEPSEESELGEEPIYSEEPVYSEEPEEPQPEEPSMPEELWMDAPTQAAQVQYRADDRSYTAVLTTLEEKQAFFQKYASSALYGGEPKLDDHYDEAFFEDHRLLVAYTYTGSGSHRLGTESIRLKNGVLEWSYNVYSTGFGTCDMAGWVLLAELPADAPVTAETAVELKGYTVIYARDSAGTQEEDPEAVLLDDLESLQAFLSRYCREDFWHSYFGRDIERVDFEQERFIGVYVPLPVYGTEASFGGLIRTAEGVEVVIKCRVPEEAPDMEGVGCVFLLWMEKDHPAASAEKITVRTEEETASPELVLFFPRVDVELPSPMQWKVLQLGYQVAEVYLQEAPEAPAVLGTFEEKEAYFAKYAQSGVYDGQGNMLPLAMEDRYDEAFFEENTLIAVYQMETSSPINTTLEYVTVFNYGVVEVVFERREPGPMDAIAQRLYFIQIPKEYILSSDDIVKVTYQAFPLDE